MPRTKEELAAAGYTGFHPDADPAAPGYTGFGVKQGNPPAENKGAPKKKATGFPKHSGGGWYELSNGKKVKGKAAAQKAEAKL